MVWGDFFMRKIIAVSGIMLLFAVRVQGVELSAKSACVIAADSCQVVYEKNSGEKLPMASTTKMMTALVAAESDKWDDVVTVSVNAQNQEGSKIYLKAGEKIKMSELVCGLMLNSGNDAAVAIAEHISGSCDEFAEAMTRRAKELGAVNTSFKNPNGLDSEGHFSTAYDLALIGRAVLENERLAPIVSTKEMKIENEDGTVTYLRNHNKLLWRYEGMEGIKTGYTKRSGRCLVTSAKRDDVRLVAVTLNAPDDWKDHTNMLDYGFSVCDHKAVVKKGETLREVTVDGKTLGLVSGEALTAVAVNGVVSDCDVVVHKEEDLKAPINKNEQVGVAKLWHNGYLTDETPLFADRDIFGEEEKKGFFDKVMIFLKKMLHFR